MYKCKEFTNSFATVLCSSCVGGDFLKVFLHLETSGVSEYTPWSGVLCGDLRDIPQYLYSSRSTLILELQTQGPPSNATGFFGNFQFIDRRKLSTQLHDQYVIILFQQPKFITKLKMKIILYSSVSFLLIYSAFCIFNRKIYSKLNNLEFIFIQLVNDYLRLFAVNYAIFFFNTKQCALFIKYS